MSEYYDPLLKPAEQRWLSKLFKWGLIMTLGIFAYGAVASSVKPNSPVAVTATGQVSTLDPQMAQFATELGIDKVLLAQTKPAFGDADAACGGGHDETTGCQTGAHQITISPGAPYDERATLAYEYMHFIWETQVNQASFKPSLNQLYALNAGVQQHYSKLAFEGTAGSDVYYDEMFSIACTRTVDSKLPPILLNECSKWLPNRSALPSYF